jgi:hypothetical protein
MYSANIINRNQLLEMINQNSTLKQYPNELKQLKKLISLSTSSLDIESKSRREVAMGSEQCFGPSYRILPKSVSFFFLNFFFKIFILIALIFYLKFFILNFFFFKIFFNYKVYGTNLFRKNRIM